MRYITITLLLFIVVPFGCVHAGNNSKDLSPLLDINAANAALLAEILPGIGPAKAALIIQWREQNGSFKQIEQLQEVKGIGPKTVDRLRPLIRIGSEAAARRMRMQHKQQEDTVRNNVHQLIRTANEAARQESIESLPTRAWYRKSILEILRTH